LANQDQIKQWLEEGIQAARADDKQKARTLFETVLRYDENNELAWIWMASVVETRRERRVCLEKVLQINPRNERARTALNNLVGVSSGDETVNVLQPESISTSTGGVDFLNIAIAILAMIIIGGVILLLQPSATDEQVVVATGVPAPTRILETATPSPIPTFPGVRVADDERTAPTLPPTFTPTVTLSPTVTFTPTATLIGSEAYRVLYTVLEPDNIQPTLYESRGNGTNEIRLLGDVRDIAVSADGRQVVFAREVIYTSEANPDDENDVVTTEEINRAFELFIAPITDLGNSEQVTDLQIADALSPSWSPDGSQIVFTSDYDGDDELWILDVNTGNVTQLTENDAVDREPHWSPDGNQIVFTSDQDSPTLFELYLYNFRPNDADSITRLTNLEGNSVAPRFSPDGNQIVYVNDRTGDGDIFVISRDGSRNIILFSDDDADDRQPTWSPDGEYIAFISNREQDEFHVYLSDNDGDTITRISQGNYSAQNITFDQQISLDIP